MYVSNDASKMVIRYNSRLEIEVSGTSDLGLSPPPFEIEY